MMTDLSFALLMAYSKLGYGFSKDPSPSAAPLEDTYIVKPSSLKLCSFNDFRFIFSMFLMSDFSLSIELLLFLSVFVFVILIWSIMLLLLSIVLIVFISLVLMVLTAFIVSIDSIVSMDSTVSIVSIVSILVVFLLS